MPDSSARHFTVVDDWVTLNSEINSTEYRVYAIIKGNLVHGYGAVPESGFRVTAGWVAKMSNGMFSLTTAHRALRGLADKGVLLRLNHPKKSGVGAEFEFVVRPDESYKGPRSVMEEAAKLAKVATRSVNFAAIPLDKPPNPKNAKVSRKPASVGALLGGEDEGQEDPQGHEPAPPPEDDSEEDFEFDVSGLDQLNEPQPPAGRTTPEMEEFAAELEFATAKHSEEKLKLMEGACRRIAEHARPALERGWEPKVLARRLSAELNPRIHSPEYFLVTKFKDIGNPPIGRRNDGKIRVDGQFIDPSTVDLGFGHDLAPVRGATKTSPGIRQRRESMSDRLAALARKSRR